MHVIISWDDNSWLSHPTCFDIIERWIVTSFGQDGLLSSRAGIITWDWESELGMHDTLSKLHDAFKVYVVQPKSIHVGRLNE